MIDPFAAELGRLTPEQRNLLLQRVRQRRAPSAAGPRPRPEATSAPLSSAQYRLWLLDQLAPGDPAYNIAFDLRIAGDLDPVALEHAIRTVVGRHDALCTVIRPNQDGQPHQYRLPPEVIIDRLDLSDGSGDEVDAVARSHSGRGFDLHNGPLCRFLLLRTGQHAHLLLVAVHHIVFDAASAALFGSELATAYAGTTLPTLPIGFGDWCVWEQERRTARLGEQLPYWVDRLRDSPALCTLPPDHPRPERADHRARQHRTTVPSAVVHDLARLCASEAASLYSGLLAGFAVTLRACGAGDRIVIGTPASTRTHPAAQSVIGCFFNPQALVIDLADELTGREAVRRAHTAVREAQAHQDVAYADVVTAARSRRTGRYNPLFQTMLSLVERPAAGWDSAGVRFVLGAADSGASDMDLFVSASRDGDGGLTVVFRSNAALYTDATVAAAVARFGEVLHELAMEPDAAIGGATPAAAIASAGPTAPYRAPAGERETTLAAIWARVLELPRVGVDDNFFRLGGDSMQVIHAVTAATEAGVAMRPQDLMAHPTVSELAGASLGRTPRSAQPAAGPVAWLPAQRWFLSDVAPHLVRPEDYCHPYLLQLRQEVDPQRLARCVTELTRRHDALRTRISEAGPDLGATVPYRVVEPDRSEPDSALIAGERAALRYDESLVRVVHQRPDRLLLLCHHLVVDGLSRMILLEDLRTLLAGREPVATTPYAAWAAAMPDYARSLRPHLAFWQEQRRPVDLPRDRDVPGERATIRRDLTAQQTAALSPGNPGTALLTATAQALAQLSDRTSCAVALSTPGRDAPLQGLDVSRTVGWFQTFYPLLLPADPRLSARAARPKVGAAIEAAPSGLTFGLLRYLLEEPALVDLPGPQVSFNWLGRAGFEHAGRARDVFTVLDPAVPPAATRNGRSGFLLDVSGSTHRDRLGFRLRFSTGRYTSATVEALADEITRRLVG